jgi:pimeloyl-ACP methyl ester carboxylesterase
MGAPNLGPGIDADERAYDWDGGEVRYCVGGNGAPIVLLHSHNAAASSYEVRPLFHALATDHRVYAPDLPGFGRSERRGRTYFAHTYVRFLLDFLREVVDAPAAVIAASVSGSHAVIAASEEPDAISHLVLASPTGLSDASANAPVALRRLGGITHLPVWGRTAYNALVSRQSIRWHLENLVYLNPWFVTHEMVEHAWAASHQPNSIFAPASFLTGSSWADAREAFVLAPQPMLLVWGDSDRLNPLERSASFVAINPRAMVQVVTQCGGAPYDERVEEFASLVRAFLADSDTPLVSNG